jgi:hypothetical protein
MPPKMQLVYRNLRTYLTETHICIVRLTVRVFKFDLEKYEYENHFHL